MSPNVATLALLAVTVLALTACAPEAPPPPAGIAREAICGGEDVNTLPGVGVFAGEEGTGGCTATLITPRHLVTAAHCTFGMAEDERWLAELDHFEIEIEGEPVRAPLSHEHLDETIPDSPRGTWTYPGYESDDRADVALVRLAEPLDHGVTVALWTGPIGATGARATGCLRRSRDASEPEIPVGLRSSPRTERPWSQGCFLA